ncbi:preprotein translocase subunit YajC [Bombiscardovia apis]|uniref:Preprotein translocase subunit YajC n=1 Tax=Bombiscardovia apis TaxID=2932182 RepID=A0ABM8BCS2_9BIFI|nr:preprotein translocase subunit YajC [Bombiscardovia apis]BDR54683.1 preprotein translocase subunit YajC [Bombiscardovia apis]
MQSNVSSMLFLIILILLMFGMSWWSTRKNKQRQGDIESFRRSLEPGTEVSTASGLLGTIVSVDLEKEQVVIDSEGTQSRWRIQAVTKPPVVPAYVHDDEVDENGNPLPAEAAEPSTDDSQAEVQELAEDQASSTQE